MFRSNKHIYCQVIDDAKGITLAAASTLDQNLRQSMDRCATKNAASAVGTLIAERAKAAGIDTVVLDRGAYLFHGRIKALADSAREGGLSF